MKTLNRLVPVEQRLSLLIGEISLGLLECRAAFRARPNSWMQLTVKHKVPVARRARAAADPSCYGVGATSHLVESRIVEHRDIAEPMALPEEMFNRGTL